MDFSYYKYLFYISRINATSIKGLSEKFNIGIEDSRNVLSTLKEFGYIKQYGDASFRPTFKCKHFFKSIFFKWLFQNLLAIIAIIISIIALFK